MHANHREDKDAVFAGDIVAAVGLKNTTTGDTLCDPSHPIVLERMEFPEPVISVAIEPKTKVDQDKLGKALGSLSEEDPTFQVRTDDETGQTIIARHGRAAPRGARRPDDARVRGRRQRRQAAGRLPRDDHRSRSRRSRSATSARPVVGVSTATSSSASSRPARAAATSSSTRSWAASIPREYIPAVDAGIQEAMEGGVVAGYPLVDVRAILTGGSYHDVDSSEMAFKIAGSMALKKAARHGQAGAARADHGGRGRHPRGLHG